MARGGIKFNHAKHLPEYFKQPDYTARAPQSCTECHTGSPAEHKIRTPGFDTACARCHANQIAQNDLVLLRLPEPAADATTLLPDDATTFMAWLFQRAGTTNYGVTLQQFIAAAAAKEGLVPFAKALDAQGAHLTATNGANQPTRSTARNALRHQISPTCLCFRDPPVPSNTNAPRTHFATATTKSTFSNCPANRNRKSSGWNCGLCLDELQCPAGSALIANRKTPPFSISA